MDKLGFGLASALAMVLACDGGDDDQAWGPSPSTIGDGSSPSPDDEGEDDQGSTGEGGSEGGDGGGGDEGASPPAGDSDGGPPGTDDGGVPPPGDDGGPPPPPSDDGGVPPGEPSNPQCDAFCATIESCGWLEAGETAQDCALGCAEPLDMGPCDAAWFALAGCLSSLDCATLDVWDGGAPCQAEAEAEMQACAGA